MITTLALDPATLTLNFDPTAFGPESATELNACFEAACSDSPAECKTLLQSLANHPLHDLYANFISSVWHEKRHFLDLVLTNYGAFHLREFFQIYMNLPLLLAEAKSDNGAIFCPIDAYLDPVRRRVHNLSERTQLNAVATAISKAKGILAEDAHPRE